MSIDTKILTEKPREESGSTTSRKYQFQKDLSLYILLKEHSIRNDYLFLFDFHEDLIISNSATTIKDLECIQIKSKDKGNWTINELAKGSKNKRSILGKLYNNKIVFEDVLKSLCFISNGHYNFKKLKSGSNSTKMTKILAKDLSASDSSKYELCITREHSISKSEFESIGEFRVTILSNFDSSTHCVGALAALINSIKPSSNINSQLAYEQVSREITRKTNETVADKSFTDISDIFKIKGLSKREITEFLDKAGLYKSVEDEWNEVKTSLELEGVKYLALMKYKSAWREMSARLIAESGSIPLRSLNNEIEDIIKTEEYTTDDLKLLEVVNHLFNLVSINSYSEYFTKCLIIYKLNES